MNHLSSNDFFPVDIDFLKKPVQVRWYDFKNQNFEDPFFERNYTNAVFNDNTNFVETPLTELMVTSKSVNRAQPKGFIFHMSRCGSTLVGNMFNQLNKNIVQGEPKLPLKILGLLNNDNQEYVYALLKSSIELLGRKRNGSEENLIIKFFTGTTIFLPAILKVFPDVPRIYMYRDPVEVLVSNLKGPDQFWIYQAEMTGLTARQMTEENTPLVNCAHAIARASEAFLERYDKNCLVVNYNQIGRALLEKLIVHFNMSFSTVEIDQMMKAMDFYAKAKTRSFLPDGREKQEQASAKLRSVAEEIVGPVYQRLVDLTVQL